LSYVPMGRVRRALFRTFAPHSAFIIPGYLQDRQFPKFGAVSSTLTSRWYSTRSSSAASVEPWALKSAVSFLLTPISEGIYTLSDGYSTPARCGCQDLITIYCISKQLLGRCLFRNWFSTDSNLTEAVLSAMLVDFSKPSA